MIKLPGNISALQGRLQWEVPAATMSQWNPAIQAAETSDNTIGIYDVIGDYWGEGVSEKRISAALRSIGADQDVVVNINSPGGDTFSGIAIHNLLAMHKGAVTINVVGLAASAASIIASVPTAQVNIATGGMLMIHNCWTGFVGNRNDFQSVADYMLEIDKAMADVYAVRSGQDRKQVMTWMDAETYMGGELAVERGFADRASVTGEIIDAADDEGRLAAHQLDVALARSGMPRSERRKLIAQIKSGTPSAASNGTPSAAGDTPRAVNLNLEPLPKLQFPT